MLQLSPEYSFLASSRRCSTRSMRPNAEHTAADLSLCSAPRAHMRAHPRRPAQGRPLRDSAQQRHHGGSRASRQCTRQASRISSPVSDSIQPRSLLDRLASTASAFAACLILNVAGPVSSAAADQPSTVLRVPLSDSAEIQNVQRTMIEAWEVCADYFFDSNALVRHWLQVAVQQ